MRKVLFTGNILDAHEIEELKNEGIDIKSAGSNESEAVLDVLLEGCEGYIVGGDEIVTAKLINNHKDTLKIISYFGVGYEKYINVKVATENGIVVTNAPKANSRSVAEYTVALILDCLNKITYTNKITKAGVWSKYLTSDLFNKEIGIIGLGNIGKYVAEILSLGFGAKVYYCNIKREIELESKFNLKHLELSEILKKCDIISLHVNYSTSNINMISREQFDLMRNNVILINTARAELVNKTDLLSALKQNKVSTYAIDGFYEEPINYDDIINKELLEFTDDRVLITSHNAFNSKDALEKTKEIAISSILSYFKNGYSEYILNKSEINFLKGDIDGR